MTLKDFFTENPRVALGFSGGVDSVYLLHAALAHGADIRAYFVKSAFQPTFELEDAKRAAKELNADMTVIELDTLADDNVAQNPHDRCYYCKLKIFGAIKERAATDGYRVLLDGTNASDDQNDRAGMRATGELDIRSPLRECGLTKDKIRKRSKEAGLFTWDKPAYAYLATRVPTGTPITAELLIKIEAAENALFALGFTDFRCRILGNAARLEFTAPQMKTAVEKREQILEALAPHFEAVLMDFKGRIV